MKMVIRHWQQQGGDGSAKNISKIVRYVHKVANLDIFLRITNANLMKQTFIETKNTKFYHQSLDE